MLVWIIGILFILVRGNLADQFRFGGFEVDLVAIITAYILLSRGAFGAGIFAFGQGLLIDCYSAGLVGLFTLLYLVVFLGMSVGSGFFDPNSPRAVMILVATAVLTKGILLLGILNVFSLETYDASAALVSVLLSALFSGLLAPVVFHLLNHLYRFVAGKTKEAG